MSRDLQAVIRQAHRRLSEALTLLERHPVDHPDYDVALGLVRGAVAEMVAVYGREEDVSRPVALSSLPPGATGQAQLVADALASGSIFVGYGVAVVPLGTFDPAETTLADHIGSQVVRLLVP